MRIKKRKKSSRYKGWKAHGRGDKRKPRGSGHRGGVGMAGTGKRGDQRKSLVINLYGNDYFGKDKALRRGNKPKKLDVMDLAKIAENIELIVQKGMAKKSGDSYEVDLIGYKVLGNVKDLKLKLKIKASAASASAVESVKKAGGEVIVE